MLAAITAVVLQLLAASRYSDLKVEGKMKIRNAAVLLTSVLVLLLGLLSLGCSQAEEAAPAEEAAAPPAESATEEPVFTRNDPGAWEGKETGHLPVITYEKSDTGLKVNVVVNHVMDDGAPHYIMWIKLFDGDGNLLGQQEFEANDEKAEASFELTSVPAKLVAHEKCNVHGIWMEQVDVS
jgi:desulfoferrodoxin-like iron-binding protein